MIFPFGAGDHCYRKQSRHSNSLAPPKKIVTIMYVKYIHVLCTYITLYMMLHDYILCIQLIQYIHKFIPVHAWGNTIRTAIFCLSAFDLPSVLYSMYKTCLLPIVIYPYIDAHLVHICLCIPILFPCETTICFAKSPFQMVQHPSALVFPLFLATSLQFSTVCGASTGPGQAMTYSIGYALVIPWYNGTPPKWQFE